MFPRDARRRRRHRHRHRHRHGMVWYGMVGRCSLVPRASCLVKEGSGSGITRIPTDEPSPKPLSIKASSSYLRGWAWLLFFFQSFSLSVFLFSLSLFPETKRKESQAHVGLHRKCQWKCWGNVGEMLGKCWVSRQFFSCFVFSIDGVSLPFVCVCCVHLQHVFSTPLVPPLGFFV